MDLVSWLLFAKRRCLFLPAVVVGVMWLSHCHVLWDSEQWVRLVSHISMGVSLARLVTLLLGRAAPSFCANWSN